MKKSDPPLVAGGGFGCHRKFKLTVIVLLLFSGGNGLPVKAAAQSAGDPPSVMDRIREKVRERPKPPPADWFHRLDTNRDRRISKIEVNVSINRRFSVLDTNRDKKSVGTNSGFATRSPANPGPPLIRWISTETETFPWSNSRRRFFGGLPASTATAKGSSLRPKQPAIGIHQPPVLCRL